MNEAGEIRPFFVFYFKNAVTIWAKFLLFVIWI
jgi:hypothetical protein